MKYLCLLSLVLFISTALAAPAEDRVHLNISNYDHNWYSGYLQFDTGRYHYVYFQSQRDPNNDPVNWWFNGGPGCSSMMGMFYENGPFVFNPNSHEININKYAWNLKSNVLYVETPGGVGFSQGFRNDTYSDDTTTEDNMKALLKFYEKFPTLKNNELYLTGQSYAGVYIPYLSNAIVKYNKLPNKQMTINLKGFMINNACTDHRECYQPRIVHSNSIYQYQYLYDHGFYTESEYDYMRAACIMGYNSEACQEIRKQLDSKFAATNTSIYNIYLPCYYQKVDQEYKLTQSGGRIEIEDGYSCDDSIGMIEFLNQPAMHEYLHVDSKKFEDCNSAVSSKYQKSPDQSYPIYVQLLKSKQDLRIWVTSGDHDADVPLTGTLNWIQRLREEADLPIEEPWREWWVKGIHKHEDQVGGMSWTLRGLTFATIKGAGHMAHKDQRQASLVMYQSFIRGHQLPFKDQQ